MKMLKIKKFIKASTIVFLILFLQACVFNKDKYLDALLSDAAPDAPVDSTVDVISPDSTVDIISPDSTVDVISPDTSCDSLSNQDKPWAKSAGGTSLDQANGIAVDINGNVFVTGFYTGTAIFESTTLSSAGNTDIFVAKYDSLGTYLWAERAGGTNADDDRATGIAVDNSTGNVFVTGFFTGTVIFGNTTLSSAGITDIFVAKYNSNGQGLWAIRAGGTKSDRATGIAVDNSTGNVFVTGCYYSGEANFGTTMLTTAGEQDIFVAKYDVSLGQWGWAKSAGGTGSDQANGIAVDINGNVYVTGHYYGTATFGNLQSLSSKGGGDIFVASYYPDGQEFWATSAGGDQEDKANGIAVDNTGRVLVTGFCTGTAIFGSTTLSSAVINGNNIFVASYASTGSFSWAKSAGGDQEDKANGIAIDSNNNVYVTGYFSSTTLTLDSAILTNKTALLTPDIFVAKYYPDGQKFWATSAGGTESDYATAIAIDSNDHIFVTGYFYDQATFGAETLTSTGAYEDIFIWKIVPTTTP